MSALGQKRTCAAQKGMSALPPKADMCSAQLCPLSAKSGHRRSYFATSSAAFSRPGGTVRVEYNMTIIQAVFGIMALLRRRYHAAWHAGDKGGLAPV